MKVLVTGGCGFIGSHVCDKFNREGYEVFIIDNLSTGQKQYVKHKHRLYEMNIEDPKIEEVFKSNRFDVVVHLAAQADRDFANKHPYMDARINVLGTVNLLNLASKYKCKRFVFISSDEVYSPKAVEPISEGNQKNPASELGLDKMICETYCNKWRAKNGLDTVILRVGNVYGPRQGISLSCASVANWVVTLLKGNPIQIPESAHKMIHLIYVEDVAEAIYKAASIRVNEALNIGSNQQTSLQEVFNEMSSLMEDELIQYHPGSCELHLPRHMDNTLAKKLLDWQPLTQLSSGMQKTIEWYSDHLSDFENEIKAKPVKGRRAYKLLVFKDKLIIAAESIAGLLMTLSYKGYYLQRNLEEPFDMGLIFIILFSTIYGSKMGIITILLSIIATIIAYIGSGKEPLILLYQTDFFLRLAFYVFIGFLIGYIKDKNERQIESNYNQINILEEKLEFTTLLYKDMSEIRDELQNQIVNSEDSFGKIFSVVQTLDSLSPDDIFADAVSVIEKLMKTNAVAIYKFDEGSYYARLMANSAALSGRLSKSIKIEEHPEIRYTIKHRDLFVSREIGEGKPVMAMPVFDRLQLIGCIVIYQSEFERLTLSYQNYFKVITSLIATSLMKAYIYDAAVEKDRYIEGTEILKTDCFNEMLMSRYRLKHENGVAFSVLEVEYDKADFEKVGQLANSVLRDTDAIGLNEEEALMIILSNTENEEAQFVINRLEKLGVNVTLLRGGQ